MFEREDYEVKEEQLSKEELIHLLKQKDMLISILSHDLINSFNSLLLFSRKVASDKELPEKYHKPMRAICSSSERAYAILENLRVWAKTKTTYRGYPQKITNLSEIIQAIVAVYADKITEKSLSVNINVDDSCHFMCDREQLFSILRNIFSNAIKFSRSNNLITISKLSMDHQVYISISDNGIGMSEEKLEKLFSPESLQKKTGTSGETGLGFGVLLTKELVENNGGNITCSSTLDKGTTFTISFPLLNP